jgi:ribonuclease HI
MTYVFPPSLEPLRKYLKGRGFEGDSIKTSRQAAFVAQQLLGSRVKFPPQGQDMTPTLLSIQNEIGGVEAASTPGRQAVHNRAKEPAEQGAKGGRSLAKKGDKIPPSDKKGKDYSKFTPDLFARGIHIFCDGAAVPNPGLGGWGVAVYEDGVEVGSAFGGDPQTTNNQMELTAILNAIEEAWKFVADWSEVTIWCDSQYCVKGCNEWMVGWKAKGWQRGSDKAEPKNRELANADLWKAIDEALSEVPKFGRVNIKWVKGHIGVAGNERSDELAEMGRQQAEDSAQPKDDLTERYRQIMGAL